MGGRHRMPHSLPTDPVRGPGLPDDQERSARVEELLLSGLDRYFSGGYDDAITIWTRVAFLERGHERARAYIERARQALDERHRESEELVEQGIEAYHRGEWEVARALLTSAVERGGRGDRAFDYLGRVGRVGADRASAIPAPPIGSMSASRTTVGARSRGVVWLAATVSTGAVLVAGVMLWPVSGDTALQPLITAPVGSPLPMVRLSEAVLERAAALVASGDLAGALAALDTVELADPFRADADLLRAAVQQRLLSMDSAALPTAGGVEP